MLPCSPYIVLFRYIYFLNAALPSRSISRPSWEPRPAASSSLSHASTFLWRIASSAAFTRMPHFSYIVIVSPGARPLHLGTNIAATRGFPACNVRLKNGCQEGYTLSVLAIQNISHPARTSQPIGLFLVFAISSISFQSRFATKARRLCICVESAHAAQDAKQSEHDVNLPNPPRNLVGDLEFTLYLLRAAMVTEMDELKHRLIDAETSE